MILNYTQYDSGIIALIFFTIIAILYHATKTKKFTGEKTTMYACGETVDSKDIDLAKNETYNTIINTLKLDLLSDAHSGKLDEYLFLVCTAAFIIIIILVLTW
ncbi:hypothetical protein GQ473_04840 [archaeon]|nr:hypothetical protein [archaeon]